MSDHYKFFSNRECEYFPCHDGADPDNFNCLFCYCPLYFLGDKCGGNFRITKKGVKDCTGCMVPHKKENFSHITSKLKEAIGSRAKCIVEMQQEQAASENSQKHQK